MKLWKLVSFVDVMGLCLFQLLRSVRMTFNAEKLRICVQLRRKEQLNLGRNLESVQLSPQQKDTSEYSAKTGSKSFFLSTNLLILTLFYCREFLCNRCKHIMSYFKEQRTLKMICYGLFLIL